METNELINSGLELANTLVAYLAKDAVGAEFLASYMGNSEQDKNAAIKQKETLESLTETSRNRCTSVQKKTMNGLRAFSQQLKALELL